MYTVMQTAMALVAGAGILALIFMLINLRMRRHLEQEKAYLESKVDLLESQKTALADAGMKLLELKEALEVEQARSQKLLRNILPERVIKELQEKGSIKPERYSNVSVLFADIVNFTATAATMEPADLIVELSDIFSEFDTIFSRHNCERIKTLGDAYMAASGLPDNSSDHCRNILSAAIEARDYLAERNRQPGNRQWLMRFGINCGSVVGGIVGREKYIYDILGDTVNIASRIEHTSEAMKINVSHSVYLLTADEFDFTTRGMVEVKGRGAMQMYFLEGRKTV